MRASWQDISTPLTYDPTANVSVAAESISSAIDLTPITFSSDRGKGVTTGDFGYYDHMTAGEARRLGKALIRAADFVEGTDE